MAEHYIIEFAAGRVSLASGPRLCLSPSQRCCLRPGQHQSLYSGKLFYLERREACYSQIRVSKPPCPCRLFTAYSSADVNTKQTRQAPEAANAVWLETLGAGTWHAHRPSRPRRTLRPRWQSPPCCSRFWAGRRKHTIFRKTRSTIRPRTTCFAQLPSPGPLTSSMRNPTPSSLHLILSLAIFPRHPHPQARSTARPARIPTPRRLRVGPVRRGI